MSGRRAGLSCSGRWFLKETKTLKTTVSARAARIAPSPTLVVSAQAEELAAAGHDIIALGAGEPDFDTPEHIREAAIQAIHNGKTRYTAAGGLPELKQAIVDKFQRENALSYEPAQILVSCGAKHSIYNLMQALLDPGDEVIIPAPYWVSYPDATRLTGAKPVIVPTGLENRFKLSAEQLSRAITGRTRLLVLNSPANPSGVCYSRAELSALADVLLEHPEIVILSDDIYEHILWGATNFVNIVNACPALYDRTVVVNGVSKAYAMTGWRIGYLGGPQALVGAMHKIQSHSTSNPTSISQYAAIAALQGDQSYIKESTITFRQRHDFVLAGLNDLNGVECVAADGAFYSFPRVTEAIARRPALSDDVQLCKRLLEEAGVALVPGSAFGAPGYMRLSYATSMENLQAALGRLGDVLG